MRRAPWCAVESASVRALDRPLEVAASEATGERKESGKTLSLARTLLPRHVRTYRVLRSCLSGLSMGPLTPPPTRRLVSGCMRSIVDQPLPQA